MDDIIIRPATVQDVPVMQKLLEELAGALGKSEEIRGTESDLERFGFSDHPRFEAVLACAGSNAVGLAVFFYEYSTWRGFPGVYVQDLYVDSRHRGRGLGRGLLDAVKTEARRWGGRYVKLTVYGNNPAALAFYRQLGFARRRDEVVLVLRD